MELLLGPTLWQALQRSPLHHLSSLENTQLVHLTTAHHCQLYTVIHRTCHHTALMSRPDTKRRDTLSEGEADEPRWQSLYSTLIPCTTGDLGWWLLHRAISMGMYLVWFKTAPDMPLL